MSAWCLQRVLSCLLWLGLGVACAFGGAAEAASRRDAVETAVRLSVADATLPSHAAPACDRFAADCPSVPGERHTDEPMKRRHVARRALPVVDVAAACIHDATPSWIVLPDVDDGSVVASFVRGLLPATRTTRNAQRRRHLRVLGGRAPPASA